MAGTPPDIDALDAEGLKELLLRVLEKNAALRAEVAALREENRRLKGLKGPSSLTPSGMDKGTAPQLRRGFGKRFRGPKNARLALDEDRIVRVEVPAGSRFKGYEDFWVQDLVVKPQVIRYRRERWLTPDGETLVAPLPPGLKGHFGPALRRFVLAQYHQGQVTVERLTALLRDLGVDISKRQVVRLLSAGHDGFLHEDRSVLGAGLATAAWITVDDTGARHKDRNATCTRIGNDHFTWFATTFSKSRLNFLSLLSAGAEMYVVNAAALEYMRARQLPGPLLARLAGGKRRFEDGQAWARHLDDLAIPARAAHPDPAGIATEGALWGGLVARGLFEDTVILSRACPRAGLRPDPGDAGQFNVGRHALCWVHAERLVHALDTFSERRRRAKDRIQARIWWLYADCGATIRMIVRLLIQIVALQPTSRPIVAIPPRPPSGPCAPASTACSRPAPGSPPWTGCSPACTPTATNCSSCWSARTFRSTPTTPKTTSDARSPGARSPAAPAPRPAATAATPSSAS
jgi:hypothetical protein